VEAVVVVLETVGLIVELLELQTQVAVAERQKVALAQVVLVLSSFATHKSIQHQL
jgi:hypothetical protein